MNQLQLASISLKVLGIYSLIRALVLTENFFHTILATRIPTPSVPVEQHQALLILSSLVPIALLLAAGIFLILQSGRLAPSMAGPGDEDGSGASVTPHVFQSIAFSVLGLYLCVSAIPGLFGILWNLFALNEAAPAEMRTNVVTQAWACGAKLCLQFFLGLWLFFGARGFSNLWFAVLTLRARAGA